MLEPEQYLGVVAERVQRTGGRVIQVPFGPVTALVGLFTESVMMSTMNYCVVAAPLPDVPGFALQQFTGQAMQHARANVVGTVGWTAGSVVIAGLVGNRVRPDAVAITTPSPATSSAARPGWLPWSWAPGRCTPFAGPGSGAPRCRVRSTPGPVSRFPNRLRRTRNCNGSSRRRHPPHPRECRRRKAFRTRRHHDPMDIPNIRRTGAER